MSVLIIGKYKGDVATFRKALADRPDEFAAWKVKAQAAGSLHHRFAVGDGHVVVVDEWESPEDFEKFFDNPDLQAFVASCGADTSAPPEITITEAIESPDQF